MYPAVTSSVCEDSHMWRPAVFEGKEEKETVHYRLFKYTTVDELLAIKMSEWPIIWSWKAERAKRTTLVSFAYVEIFFISCYCQFFQLHLPPSLQLVYKEKTQWKIDSGLQTVLL